MGWEPTTTYAYDADGRLISSQPEVEWDDTQREGMLGLAEYRTSERCPRCGGPKHLCQSSEAEGLWQATAPIRCHIATTVAEAQKAYLDGPHAPHPQALIWGVERTSSEAPAVHSIG